MDDDVCVNLVCVNGEGAWFHPFKRYVSCWMCSVGESTERAVEGKQGAGGKSERLGEAALRGNQLLHHPCLRSWKRDACLAKGREGDTI